MSKSLALVVADELPFARNVATALVENGFTGRFADDVRVAISVARGEPPDWLLIEFPMAKANALAVVFSVRSVAPACRVVLLASAPGDEVSCVAAATGAVAVLARPITAEVLAERLVIGRQYVGSEMEDEVECSVTHCCRGCRGRSHTGNSLLASHATKEE
jgi:ActR/RegA family two-component response regulator